LVVAERAFLFFGDFIDLGMISPIAMYLMPRHSPREIVLKSHLSIRTSG